MTLIISQHIILKTQEKGSEPEKIRINHIKHHTNTEFIYELEERGVENMSGAQIRKELRKEFPVHNSAGLPYCYRIADPHQRLKTIFPDIQAGEKVAKQGRLDWDELLAQKQNQR